MRRSASWRRFYSTFQRRLGSAPSAAGDLNRAIWAAISAGTITSATTTTASGGGKLKTAALLTGDRWFESCSLQQRVQCEPYSSPCDAHVILTVSRFEIVREFYRRLLPEFGMKPVFDGDKLFYCVGARTAIGIEPCCDPALAGERFVQQRVGLHHLCLRARSREDVDRCAAFLKEMDARIVRGPMEGSWARAITTCCSTPQTASG